MKKNTGFIIKTTLSFLLFFSLIFSVKAANEIGVTLTNCSATANTLDIDITIRNNSGLPMVLQTGRYGIDWNYAALGGSALGSVTIAYVPGSSQLVPAQSLFNSTNTIIEYVLPAANPTRSIRIDGPTVTSSANGTTLPVATNVRVGTFRLTLTTGNWTPGSVPNFTWVTTNVTGKTRTTFNVYMNGSSAAVAGTISPPPSVTSPCNSLILNLNCPTVNTGGPYSSCGDVQLNGSLGGNATTATWSSPTGGTFTPGPSSLNAVYHPSAADLSNGSVTLTLTSNNPFGLPCVQAVGQELITFLSVDDNNICTVDACDQSSGLATHTAENVVINSVSPSAGYVGTEIEITGSNFLLISNVLFNGSSTTYTIVDNSTINLIVPPGQSGSTISLVNPCNSASDNSFVLIDSFPLNVNVFIQGYYQGNGEMRACIDPVVYSTICDSIQLRLADANSPHNISGDTYNGFLHTDGKATFILPLSLLSNSFYLILKHRSALETWSANPLTITGQVLSYDFTSASAQAFGNNQTFLGNGVYGLWSGDVNQDGQIESIDFSLAENAIAVNRNGYFVEDLTGNLIVDIDDIDILESNLIYFPVVLRP